MHLYLLRHAQAANSAASDKDRPLTEAGTGQAQAIAQIIKQRDSAPSHILCSTAQRTRETLSEIIDIIGPVPTDFQDALYNAPADTILKSIQDADCDNLLIVAHNPGIHQLVHSLAGTGPEEKLQQLTFMYAPATLTILDGVPEPGKMTLVDLITP